MKRWAMLGCSLLITATGMAANEPVTLSRDLSKITADALALVGPAAEPAPKELRIKPGDKVAFMGDSITAGGGYVRLASAVVQNQYPNLKLPAFVNGGISGQKAENMEPRFTASMQLSNKTAWTFINVGINDVWHRLKDPHDPAVLAAYKTNVTKMVEKAQAAGATPVLLTPTVIQEDPNSEGNKRLPMYVAAMKEVAAEKQCQVVDLHAMFLTAISHKPADLKLTGDGVHMGLYGDTIMAIGVLRAFGVPDATIAGVDCLGILQCKVWNMSVKHLAELLEIPVTRFDKPELRPGLSF